jgi:hypothetical protein
VKLAVEQLLLADDVTVRDGRIEAAGGSYDTLLVRDISLPIPISFVCDVAVPPSEVDRNHLLSASLTTHRGTVVATLAEERFRAGHPSGDRREPVHVPFVVRADVVVPDFGEYRIAASVDGRRDGSRSVDLSIRPADSATETPVISEEEQNFFDEEMGLI